MLTHDFAQHFAGEWINAWNSHDLDRILSHYADDFEMASPRIAELMGESSGVLVGKPAIRAYWALALTRLPDLRFQLLDVLAGVETICIYYESRPGIRAAEWFQFGADGKVAKAMAHYARPTS